jgi:hypothetical protein
MDEISFYSFLRTSFRKGYVHRINRLRDSTPLFKAPEEVVILREHKGSGIEVTVCEPLR